MNKQMNEINKAITDGYFHFFTHIQACLKSVFNTTQNESVSFEDRNESGDYCSPDIQLHNH